MIYTFVADPTWPALYQAANMHVQLYNLPLAMGRQPSGHAHSALTFVSGSLGTPEHRIAML
jgi:hypothetical protein